MHEPLGNGNGRLLRAAPRRERVRLLGRDQVEARYRDVRALGKLVRDPVELGRLALGYRLRPAHLEREPGREPEHREVHRDGYEGEDDDAARAADEGSEPDEERREPGDEDPSADTGRHVLLS